MLESAQKSSLALVTVPDAKTARRLVKAALDEKLVACGNIIPGLESHYWWKGKMERAREVLILFKTRTSRLKKLEKLVRDQHPYETPEFITLKLDSGSRSYLRWLRESAGK